MDDNESKSMFDWMCEMGKDARSYHQQLKNEHDRLAANNAPAIPTVGQRVLVASGLLGRGHPWIRKECVVVEVGENAAKVECTNPTDKWTEWVAFFLITDLLPMTAR